MPVYHKLGRLPAKRHVAFRKDDGSLYYEHLMGNLGFTGLQSLLYTLRRPTTVKAIEPAWVTPREAEPDSSLRLRHLRSHRLPPAGGSAVRDRRLLLFNDDVSLSLTRPTAADPFFYRNARADEVVYVARGGGRLESQFGSLPYREGDYLVVPRAIIHRLVPDPGEQIHLVIESRGDIRTPKRYR
ncbi:homogentisate 1,2-dioxygenase, partial [bacterium]|nr:homogentisate 1,2-dioxygenase [bacterium]